MNLTLDDFKRKVKQKKTWIDLMPFIIFILVFIFLIIMNLNADPMTVFANVMDAAIPCALVSIGAIFIYSMGSFDISLGIATAMSAAVGTLAYNATHNVFVLLIACIGVGLLLGFINSCLAGVFKLPIFVTTIAITTVLTVTLTLVQNSVPGRQFILDTLNYEYSRWYGLIGVLLFFGLIYLIYNYTDLGRKAKMISSNKNCSKLSGINETLVTILAFTLSGIGVGLAAFFTLQTHPTTTSLTGSSIGLDVMVAIVFGGMPLSGGARSRVTAGLLGAFIVGMIRCIFVGELSNYITIIEGALFLLIVGISGFGYRNKYLVK